VIKIELTFDDNEDALKALSQFYGNGATKPVPVMKPEYVRKRILELEDKVRALGEELQLLTLEKVAKQTRSPDIERRLLSAEPEVEVEGVNKRTYGKKTEDRVRDALKGKKGWIRIVDFAEEVGIAPNTLRARLKKMGDVVDRKRGWVKVRKVPKRSPPVTEASIRRRKLDRKMAEAFVTGVATNAKG